MMTKSCGMRQRRTSPLSVQVEAPPVVVEAAAIAVKIGMVINSIPSRNILTNEVIQ